MILTKSTRYQGGVALVFSLLLLLVLTVIGVAAMNSTVMQERMAGNQRMQTETFEVASEGVSRSLEFYYDNTGNVQDIVEHDDGLLCGFVHRFAGTTVDDRLAWRFPAQGFETIYTQDGFRLDQQMYCCRNWAQVEVDGNLTWVENPSKLFVLNRGTAMTGDDDDADQLARREVEVRLDEGDPGEPTCAFCVPGGIGNIDAPNSNALRMHGSCGPAITTETPEGAAQFIDAIGDNRIGNYDGGVAHGDMGSPWNDPNLLAEFVWWVKLGLDDAAAVGGGGATPILNGRYWYGNQSFGGGDDPLGTPASPEINYIDGNLSAQGNFSGAGITIVRGTISWGGTPDFQGLLISLGGDFEVSGGGGGGNPGGSMVMTNLIDPDNPTANPNLMDRHVLHHRVAEDGGEVVMFDPEAYGGDIEANLDSPRPVLRDESGGEWIHLHDGSDHRFFSYPSGDELTGAGAVNLDADGTFTLVDPVSGVDTTIPFQPFDPAVGVDNRPRDRFGRLIPDFVLFDNWPPAEWGYDPNLWGWQVDEDNPPFDFGDTDFSWAGGGNQAFTYDCRNLQRMRHRFLCLDKASDADPDLPSDFDFQDPDPTVCNHWEADEPYNDDILDLAGDMHNHFAWHMWEPSCDCLGITAQSDMILSGWRENLGWRDDDFAACAQLPAPP